MSNDEELRKKAEENVQKEVKEEIKTNAMARTYFSMQVWKTIDYIRHEFPGFSHAEATGVLFFIMGDLRDEVLDIDEDDLYETES